MINTILRSLFCIPCVWTAVSLLATFGAVGYIRSSWVPFRGPTPSDGPVEGFASKQARIEFYDTTPLRIRTAVKFGMIGAGAWLVGVLVALIVLGRLAAA